MYYGPRVRKGCVTCPICGRYVRDAKYFGSILFLPRHYPPRKSKLRHLRLVPCVSRGFRYLWNGTKAGDREQMEISSSRRGWQSKKRRSRYVRRLVRNARHQIAR